MKVIFVMNTYSMVNKIIMKENYKNIHFGVVMPRNELLLFVLFSYNRPNYTIQNTGLT